MLCATSLSVRGATTNTVLALGDSITALTNSYRGVLVPVLAEKGLPFQFIGPQKDSVSAHAGYGGKNTKFLLGIIQKFYPQYPADIVLIHSGHNSFSEDKPVPGIIQDTEAIIETIYTNNPSATILLAQVIPSGKLPKYSYIPELNEELEALSKRLITKGRAIILVNQAKGFEWQTDTVSDKVHPSPSGANKMAAKWLEALMALPKKHSTDQNLSLPPSLQKETHRAMPK
jgi:lysophospholipase L1-like esterase